jgi:glycosyltransferase involved in cell wall biosynthesis
MACHNTSAYLEEAVSSVLSQTLGDLELIIVDDCSTDDSLEIAQRYQMQDIRVSILSLPVNSGPAIARNAGILAARGNWLGILDSDDVAMPYRFEDQMRLADDYKDLVMIGSSSVSIDEKGFVISGNKYPTRHPELVKNLYTLRKFPPHSSMVYRKNVVEKLTAFNRRYAHSEDYDLWLRLSEIGKIASIDKPLVKIRKHEQNISNLRGGMLQTLMGCAALTCHFLRIHNCPDPSTHSDEVAWKGFLEWLERRLIEEGIFEKRKAWADARADYFARGNRMISAFCFGARLLQSGHSTSLVREKFFGSSLPEHLAREWTKRSCAVS